MTDDWSLKGKAVASTILETVTRPTDVITTPESGWRNKPAYLAADIETLRKKLIEDLDEESDMLHRDIVRIINRRFGVKE